MVFVGPGGLGLHMLIRTSVDTMSRLSVFFKGAGTEFGVRRL